MRLPLEANIAFVTAGAIPGTDTSPMPEGDRELGTIITLTFGISSILSKGKESKLVCSTRPLRIVTLLFSVAVNPKAIPPTT